MQGRAAPNSLPLDPGRDCRARAPFKARPKHLQPSVLRPKLSSTSYLGKRRGQTCGSVPQGAQRKHCFDSARTVLPSADLEKEGQ